MSIYAHFNIPLDGAIKHSDFFNSLRISCWHIE